MGRCSVGCRRVGRVGDLDGCRRAGKGGRVLWIAALTASAVDVWLNSRCLSIGMRAELVEARRNALRQVPGHIPSISWCVLHQIS